MTPMKLKATSLLLATSLGLISTFAWATRPFTIKDIRVEGVQRTDPGTVFNYLPIKVGDQYNDDKATHSIKSLFATGFFNDVRIETEGDIVIVTVIERPTIAEINIDGAKVFDAKQITEMLKTQNFGVAQIYDQAVLDNAVQELKNQYYAKGRYAVDIKTILTKLERNRVAVKLKIEEGNTARIKQINIIGAKAFKEKNLLDQMTSSEPDWMSWYTKTDQYSKQKLEADLESLRSFYLDRGYLEFDILSTQVNISDDKQDVFLTINLHEGEKYKISDIRLAGELLVPEVELRKLIEIKPGDVFSREKLNMSTLRIQERLGNEGYAFANVNATPEIDKEKHTVAFIFYIDPGRKTYVRRINVIGNKRTRDEVIRREIRQMESAPYSTEKIKRSKERIDQLGYFLNVNIETPPVADATDMIDLNVNVTENMTGSFQFGIGYGQTEGAAIIASLSQNNFLGTGNQFSLSVNTSKSNRVYAAQLVNPYATADGVSMGWSLYRRDYKPDDIDLGQYRTSAWGGGLTVGVPISEYNRINLGLSAENLHIQKESKTPKYVNDFIKENGEKSWTYITSIGWGRNTLDSNFYPTSGMSTSLGGEIAVPPSDVKYYKLTASNKLFIPITKLTSFMWNIDLGYGKSYGKKEGMSGGLPFYRNFYAGGVNSVRGYETGSLGPRDNNDDSMGGNRRVVSNVELLFPVPGLKDDKATRMSLFWDAGYAFGPHEKLSFATLRQSVGIAFTWISPVGPIKLSYAQPIKSRDIDKVERFQFMLGTAF
jgi:outer membrane protein insertion porin family